MSRNVARLCAVGTEADMSRVLSWLMREEMTAEELSALSGPEALLARVSAAAEAEAGPGEGFLYEMVSPRGFGAAEAGTQRLALRRHGCGLWTLRFSWESDQPFQPEDWLALHLHAGRVLMVAQYAGEDYFSENGELIFTAGHVLEDWSRMGEVWFSLMCAPGADAEGTMASLERLQEEMEEEDCDTGVQDLLEACVSNLQALSADLADQDRLAADLAALRAERDFPGQLELTRLVAEGELWDVDRAEAQLTELRALLDAWGR